MAVSEAQKKSAQKWDAANLDRVSIAMPKGMKDMVKAAAAVAGESMNQYIIGATEQRMNGLQQPAGAPQGMGAILTPETLKRRRRPRKRPERRFLCLLLVRLMFRRSAIMSQGQ